MRKKIHLTKAVQSDGMLLLHTEHPERLSVLEASGQMVVDSDEHSFVYLASDTNEYTYLYIPEAVWPEIKAAMDRELEIAAVSGEERLPLSGLQEELSYLIGNIEGNSNYGESLVEKVEAVFLHSARA